MITQLPPMRCRDKQGAGYYGASRGSRTHVGVDFVLNAGDDVCSFNEGTVTKLGYPYANHPEFRYVEVTDRNGYRCRYFYCDPAVFRGDVIHVGTVLGASQDLRALYSGITPHLHFEVMKMNGGQKQFFDPIKYLAGDL